MLAEPVNRFGALGGAHKRPAKRPQSDELANESPCREANELLGFI
jgi:hypothetical protein